MKKGTKKAAIDLYSGIGGWTLGLKLAGIPVLSSFEWWKDANRTHNKNFNTDHKEVDIRTLKLSDLPGPGSVQYVVGSPPCTQFSLANRGGKGDIADGLIDIYKFLEVVEYLQPKYWAMENVPRVATILEQQLQEGPLNRFLYLFSDIRILKSSDFGVPQDRKRMIAGNLPFDLLESYKQRTPKLNLGQVLTSLNNDPVIDPIYGINLKRELLTDHCLEANLTEEERRINQETKSHHPVYNMMSFPDRLDRPSRTVTAVCTRVSRESIIIRDRNDNLRRLTIRERGVLQSFPINYQYFGASYNNKIKMIGNAVPPLLTFYIAQAMQEVKLDKLLLPHQVQDRLVLGTELAVSSTPDNQGANYPWSRSFWMAIKGLRFGSGVRFELKNRMDKATKGVEWQMNFHYGNSKNIKAKSLDLQTLQRSLMILEELENEALLYTLVNFREIVLSIKPADLQRNWSNIDRSVQGPIELVDEIADFAQQMTTLLLEQESSKAQIIPFIEVELRNAKGGLDNKKMLERPIEIFVGILLGSLFNSLMQGQDLHLSLRYKIPA
jgi:DNA (cytosine-5)-methyltransferase 1